MRADATLAKLQASPAAFRNALVIDADGGPKRLGECIEPFQRADFGALDPSWQRVAGQRKDCPYLRAYLERPRGHSKTSDLAVMVAWALFASRRRLTGVAAAADKDQAKLLRDAIERLVRANKWLREILTIDRYRVHNPHTGSELTMISSDAATSYGIVPNFILVDELTHWAKQDLWDSLVSSAAKRSDCLLVIISNAGWKESWQWKVRETFRTDDEFYFSHLDGPQASWITEAVLAQQRKLLPPQVYDRLWGNIWAAGSGDALREEDIQAAIKSNLRPFDCAKPGWSFYAGLDLSQTKDASVLAVVGRHTGFEREPQKPKPPELSDAAKILIELGMMEPPSNALDGSEYATRNSFHQNDKLVLARLEVWQPSRGQRIKLGPIEDKLVELHRKFQFAAVAIDPWNAAQMIERVRQKGLPAERVDPTPGNLREICGLMLEAFGEQRIRLFQDERLLGDIRALRIEEKQYGMRLTSPRDSRGHGDAATALGLAILAAKRRAITTRRLNRPLLCWAPD